MRLLDNSVVVTSVRNEGPFLLEWIAWYRMLGFEKMLVVHNDCTDHSPALLRLLERAGILVQKNNQIDPAKPPQPQNHAAATNNRLVKDASWVFVCDVDEYLVIHIGDGSAAALAEAVEAGHGIGMAINWRIFGSSGELTWRDRFLRRRFQRSATAHARQNSCYKTFYKTPRRFGRIRAHGPRGWRADEPWGEGDRVFLTADGCPFPDYDPVKNRLNATPHERITNELAQVNHYMIQTLEQFDFKKGTPCSAEFRDRYTDGFLENFDLNDEENISALQDEDAFRRAHDQLLAISGVERLHHLCCADFVLALCDKRGEDGTRDPRYRFHMRRALALPHHDPEVDRREKAWWRRLYRAVFRRY